MYAFYLSIIIVSDYIPGCNIIQDEIVLCQYVTKKQLFIVGAFTVLSFSVVRLF